jgi:hypothetical protein
MEQWKDIPLWEGIYQASDLGRIKSIERVITRSNGRKKFIPECILSQCLSSNGYLNVVLNRNGKKTPKTVHRLIAVTFLGCKETDIIDHINGIKTENNIENLRICTKRQNASFTNTKKWANKTSKYIGVCLCKQTNKWKAAIAYDGKQRQIGRFATQELAHEAYQSKLKEILCQNQF